MEKFGIFELLDTLSAILAAENEPSAAQKTPPQRNPAQDSAFAPPPYAGEQTPERQNANGALSSFLARHDAVSKKIDGK